jgi:hypothetical protein
MSVLAPPDRPPVEDPELDPAPAGADPKALIEEARQRARRRRLKYAAATAVLAIVGVSLFSESRSSSSSGALGRR